MIAATSRPRFPALDGMRGIAAIVVMLHHITPPATGSGLFRSAYLAVDFFFVLSGLVVALAWEERLKAGAPIVRFLASRLRRVYPVMALGIAMGSVVAFGMGRAPLMLGRQVLAHLLFLPALGGHESAFPLDGVQWSLFFELFANLLYGAWLFRLSSRVLLAIAATSYAVLVWVSVANSGLDIGYVGDTFAAGVPRVLASYTGGVLLYRWVRTGRMVRVALPYPALALLLLATLVIPGLLAGQVPAAALDPLLVLVAFPALVLLGCAAKPSRGALRWSGIAAAISFPLYAVHLQIQDGLGLVTAAPHGWLRVAMIAGVALAAAAALARTERRRMSSHSLPAGCSRLQTGAAETHALTVDAT